MAECLYYGDKPIGLIQSKAEDVEYSTGVSVKDKIDTKAEIKTKTVTDTTNANGIIALNINGGHCISCKVVGVNSNRTVVLFTYGNDWFADIKDPVNMSNIANTSVTVEVAYITS